ncbi:uncharacterized protein LOC142355909 isoform X3 [Convolutriloba macropyga]|uniref:uncharacterized protein LOC142355909 isoform X3 n=1 Tax=Convolutriloba macropyga TaxID=536237 RepID=UPI003F51DE4D
MKRYNSCYNSANLSNRGQIISNHVYENVSVFPPNFPSSIRAMESPRRSWVESENIPPPPPRRDRTRTASRRFLNSISPLNCSYLDEIVARLEQIQENVVEEEIQSEPLYLYEGTPTDDDLFSCTSLETWPSSCPESPLFARSRARHHSKTLGCSGPLCTCKIKRFVLSSEGLSRQHEILMRATNSNESAASGSGGGGSGRDVTSLDSSTKRRLLPRKMLSEVSSQEEKASLERISKLLACDDVFGSEDELRSYLHENWLSVELDDEGNVPQSSSDPHLPYTERELPTAEGLSGGDLTREQLLKAEIVHRYSEIGDRISRAKLAFLHQYSQQSMTSHHHRSIAQKSTKHTWNNFEQVPARKQTNNINNNSHSHLSHQTPSATEENLGNDLNFVSNGKSNLHDSHFERDQLLTSNNIDHELITNRGLDHQLSNQQRDLTMSQQAPRPHNLGSNNFNSVSQSQMNLGQQNQQNSNGFPPTNEHNVNNMGTVLSSDFTPHFAAGPIVNSANNVSEQQFVQQHHQLQGYHQFNEDDRRANVEAAAASFFAKATQKIAKQAKTRSQISSLGANTNSISSSSTNQGPARLMSPNQIAAISNDDVHPFDTNFGLSLTRNPPSAPPGLFRNVDRRTSTAGKLKVALRLSPENKEGIASPNSFVSVDDRRKQILLNDTRHLNPSSPHDVTTPPAAAAPPKMFAFDHVFAEDAAQAEICASTLPEVLQSVINGNDGCVFGFGSANLGKTFTMVGEDTSLQTIGVIPCAISWLFRLINDQKQKSGAKFSVRVSSVELYGKDEHVKDLLADQDTGGSFFSSAHESPGIFLQPRDASGNFSLQNHSELRAATADKAAFYLDAALAARTRNNAIDFSSEHEHKPSHMIFTLHIYQYRVDRTKKTGVCGGRSRLHLIDLGNCDRPASNNNTNNNNNGSSAVNNNSGSFLTYSALGNVLLALMNGSRHVPHRDSKLTQLLKEVNGGGTCCTVMIAHVSCQPQNYDDTLNTVQLAHKLHRTKKRKAKASFASGLRHHSSGAASSSSEYSENSSCDELGRPRRRTTVNPPQIVSKSGQNSIQASKEQSYMSSDYSSSSEQSCDTVIYRGPDGRMLSDSELTDNERPPQFSRVVSSTNQSALERIHRPSNMFKPIKESSEENDSSSKSGGGNSRTQSDSEVSVRNPSFKMSKLNRLSPKCSTPAESDQEGVFVISRPLNVAGTRRSNSVGEQDTKCASIPENNPADIGESNKNRESNSSICSACNVSYENSSMFQTQCNNQQSLNATKCKHYNGTSDSSFENLPGTLGIMNQQQTSLSTSPIRGVVSDTEVLYNAPRSMKETIGKPKTGSNLSFITEETDSTALAQQSSAGSKSTRFAVSAHSLAQSALKNVKPSFMKESKAASKKSLSTASFFKEPPAEDDVWQVRNSVKDPCQDSQPVRLHCGMSDGKRMQSTAMLVALGPQASKMCVQCSTGRCCEKTHPVAPTASQLSPTIQSPGSAPIPGRIPGSGNTVTIAAPSKSAPSRKSSILSRLRRSRTPDQTPKMKSKRFIREPKSSSRASQPSPSRKVKMKIPVLENLSNRTPENSPPRGRKQMAKESVSSQSSFGSNNECDFSAFQQHAPRYAFSDSEELFSSQKSDSSSLPSQNGYQPMNGGHSSMTSSHDSSLGDTTPTKAYEFCRLSVGANPTGGPLCSTNQLQPPMSNNVHQYETLDRVNVPTSQRQSATSYPDKTALIQKFNDARASKCHIASHPIYRLSSYTADSGLDSISGTAAAASGSPRCHPDVIESHCPPSGSGNSYVAQSPNVPGCPCQNPPVSTAQNATDSSILDQNQRPFYAISPQLNKDNVSELDSSKISDLNSVPCSPFTCSKGGRPKRSKSADRKSSGRRSIFSSMFSLRSRKSKAGSEIISQSNQTNSTNNREILSDSAPSQRMISIIDPTSQSKPPASNVARVPPVQRLQPPIVSPGSGITAGTDSDSGIELSSYRQNRNCVGTEGHVNSLEAISNISNECTSNPQNPRCCNEGAMISSSPSDLAQFRCQHTNLNRGQRVDQNPAHHHHHHHHHNRGDHITSSSVSSGGGGSGSKNRLHPSSHHKEPCSNPERCRNIKNKLLYDETPSSNETSPLGPSAEIHQAAMSGGGIGKIQCCAKCNNLTEYWVDTPTTSSPSVSTNLDYNNPNGGSIPEMSQDANAIEFDATPTGFNTPLVAGRATPEDPHNLHSSHPSTPPGSLPDPQLHLGQLTTGGSGLTPNHNLNQVSGHLTSGVPTSAGVNLVPGHDNIAGSRDRTDASGVVTAVGDSGVGCRRSSQSPQLPPPDIHACAHHTCQGQSRFIPGGNQGQVLQHQQNHHHRQPYDCDEMKLGHNNPCHNNVCSLAPVSNTKQNQMSEDKLYFSNIKPDNPKLSEVDLLQFDWQPPKDARRLTQNPVANIGSAV